MGVRGRLPSKRGLGLATVAAAAIHSGTFAAWGTVEGTSQPSRTASGPPRRANVELASVCTLDAALAMATRVASCGGPWVRDVGSCALAADAAWRQELAECTSPPPLYDVVLLPSAARLAAIDPEPMLEVLAEAKRMAQDQAQAQVAAVVPPEKAQPDPTPEPPPEPLPEPKPEPPPPPPPAVRNAQVVETAAPTEQRDPDRARFLSDNAVRVAKETVARGSRHEAMTAKSRPEQLAVKETPREATLVQPNEATGERKQGDNAAAGSLSMRNPGENGPRAPAQEASSRGASEGAAESRADGTMTKRGQGWLDQERRRASEGPSQGGGGAQPRPNLSVSTDVLERAIGGGSVDHLEGVADGDETALNAKRWVFASFFNRLKRQVAQNWEPGDVWRRHDPRGAVYGVKTRITGVRIVLDRTGALAKISVVRPSGADVLDEEAVRAFRAAGPFPNPPAGLVGADSKIRFDFAFHFEVGAPRSSWRILKN